MTDRESDKTMPPTPDAAGPSVEEAWRIVDGLSFGAPTPAGRAVARTRAAEAIAIALAAKDAARASLQAELRAAVTVLEPIIKDAEPYLGAPVWDRAFHIGIRHTALVAAASLRARLKTLTGVNTDG